MLEELQTYVKSSFLGYSRTTQLNIPNTSCLSSFAQQSFLQNKLLSSHSASSNSNHPLKTLSASNKPTVTSIALLSLEPLTLYIAGSRHKMHNQWSWAGLWSPHKRKLCRQWAGASGSGKLQTTGTLGRPCTCVRHDVCSLCFTHQQIAIELLGMSQHREAEGGGFTFPLK